MKEIYMWLIILFSAFIVAICAGFYLVTRFGRFKFIKKTAGHFKTPTFVISLIPIVMIGLLLVLTLGAMNAIIIAINLAVIWLICDGAFALVRKFSFFSSGTSHYYAGYAAIIITVIYMLIGYMLAHLVVRTDYTVSTDRSLSPLKIVQIADAHVGTTMDGDRFNEYMKEISEIRPDILLITGDLIDDNTSREDMIKTCESLGAVNTKYGVFYCFGNHDKGYNSAERRGYAAEDFLSEMKSNEVTVLEDDCYPIGEEYVLIGRADKSSKTRKPISDLIKGYGDKYTIVMDHQPSDYDAEALAGCNLVLSGHTHGGQLIPIIKAGEWMGVNDATYGYERRDNTDFIVTSGIGDWEILFKTGCKSEYNVINICPK